jgi:Protein of unknown function (DUF1826)
MKSVIEFATREMLDHAVSATDEALVLHTRDERDLGRIVEELVQAVIYEPPQLPPWFTEVAAAVESGALVVPRTVLPLATADDIAGWLAGHLPDGGLAPEVYDALFDDILGLVARLAQGSGASRFMLRIFTAAPTTECGFHVDTVPRDAPPWGLLRVYNGAGTAFVEPGNVASIAEFYRYLRRRERLEQERRDARANGDANALDRLEREVLRLDEERSFLERPGDIRVVPAGSIVAFKHLDAALYWTPHAKAKAWIHCSPMHGPARLVVNVTSPEPPRRRPR